MKLIHPSTPGEELDLFEILGANRMIAHLWCVEDVQSERPDLLADQAWEVLQAVDRSHDSNYGWSWDDLRETAERLFPVAVVDEPSPSSPTEARQALANLVAALADVPITHFDREVYTALQSARQLLTNTVEAGGGDE